MEFLPSAALAAALPLLAAFVAVFLLPVYKEWVLCPRALAEVCKQQSLDGYGGRGGYLDFFHSPGRRLFRSWDELVGMSSFQSKVFYVRIGRVVRLVVSDLSLVRELLNSDHSHYLKPTFVRALRVLGNGLFSASGDAWAKQRPLILPVLLTKEIKSKLQDMVDSTSAAVEKLAAEPTVIDMHGFFLGLTLDVLRKTVLGNENELQAEKKKLFQTLKRYHHSRRDVVFGLAATIPGYRWLQEVLCSQATKDEAWIRSIAKKSIGPHCSRLVDVLLAASAAKSMTETEVIDNSVTFLIAGHETTAAVLSWSFYLLALNPHWQNRAREEVAQVASSSPTFVAWEDLNKLKTVGLIVMETLRLFPPQPLIGRSCLEESRLGDLKVPPGVEVIVPVAAIHRSEEYWGRDAATFRPDRFDNGIKAACSDPLAYMPFGTGPRTCVGQTLAMAEAKVVLALLLLEFSWEMSGEYRHHPEVTLNLQPKFGLPVLLSRLRRS